MADPLVIQDRLNARFGSKMLHRKIIPVCDAILLEFRASDWNYRVSLAFERRHFDWRSAMTETRDEWIKKRAYSLWEEEGHPTGRDSLHWEQARAEREALESSAASIDGKEVKARPRRAAAAIKATATASKAATAAAKANGVIKPAPKKTAGRKSAT